MGSLAQTKSYLDDTNILLPYQDLNWFIHAFAERGAPLGIYLNHTKTKILTSLTPVSPICNSNISITDAQNLCEALTNLGPNSELLEGTRFSGQPLGNNAFAARFFVAKASEYASALSRILNRLHDTQTQCTLHKNCAQATIPHLLASDIYQHIDLTASPLLQTWDSPFLASILNTNHHFLSRMLNTPFPLPSHLLFIAS
jgi:hypothetical protein